MASQESSSTPSDEEMYAKASTLFAKISTRFLSKTLGEERWYLPTLAALSYVEPEHATYLYKYLILQPAYATSLARQELVRRLREVLLEMTSLIGVVKTLESVFSIAAVEREEDRDYSFSRENWTNDAASRARGETWLKTIYKHNLGTSIGPLAAHRDFDKISKEITYGLYLSDMSILNEIETELVVLSGILIQNLPRESTWHLRGLRRVGASMEDVEIVQQCVEMVADYAGVKLDRLPRVQDIEHEV
ncbi:hypothetical protein BP5796_00800 [Coleophoma crateriformis]|uniref:Carboxymuconolactone decarboxylase-like domain-containing protein n=1 Tax=Coleophoma crateriformis TaxID=565419 RepID=A0A3D8T937_9HELO|nr:hypothetical protein BP5796_00800 [Coleophoma crateriformis]